MDLMKNLSETLDGPGMAAVSALAGSDICPCCKCMICECKLKNIDEKTLLDIRKQALIRREFTDEERKRLIEELGLEEVLRMEAEMRRGGRYGTGGEGKTEFTEEERRRLIEELGLEEVLRMEEEMRRGKYGAEKQYRMEGEYGMAGKYGMDRKRKPGETKYDYSFDYYHQPDLEAYEAERRIKEEEERQREIEREKKAQEEAEEAAMKAAEERMAEEELAEQLELEAQDEGIQAEPETQEEASQFFGAEQKEDLIDEFSETPVVGDKVEEWNEEKIKEAEAWTEYKAAEWAGMRHQDMPSVVEAQTQEAVEKVALQYTTGIPDMDKIASHRPSIASRKSVLPQMELQLHAFDKSWLEETEKLSLEQTPKVTKHEEAVPPVAHVKKPKPVEAYSTGPVLRPQKTEFKPELLPLMKKKPPTAAELIQEMEAMSVSSRSSRDTTASKEEEDYFVSDFVSTDKDTKETFLTDICRCLPGYCTCGKQHYTFKKEAETEDFGMGFRPLQVDKMIPSTAEEREKVKEAKDEQEASEKSSCSCIHPEEDLGVTPVVSRIEIVAVPPTRVSEPEVKEKLRGFLTCTDVKYQKTTIIVKPEAVRYKDVIFRAIKREGLDVLDERLIQLTPEQVAEIYNENFGSAYFPMFVQQLSSSPILVIAIAGSNAIKRWNAAVGPEKNIPISWFYPASMRRRFSVNSDILDVMKLSDDFQKAKTEIRYFFPLHIIEPIIISSTMVQDYCDEFIHPTLLKGLYQIVKQRPNDPIIFLAEWLLINNPFQPFYKQIHVALART
ncbi:uncharacterized protein LOC123673842 isoform X2 [Harmonia axyridis]|nr:uncharacterized protein LOC123673842 isoform X2 [Harmonia axyridis]